MSLNSGRTAQYKLTAQFLRHFCLHGDVNDARRAGANRLKNKQTESVQHIRTKCSTALHRHVDSFVNIARNKRSAAQQNTARDARVHLIHMSAPQPCGSVFRVHPPRLTSLEHGERMSRS